MLNLQAQTLEQQERLYKNQIRLNIREILQEELNFYQHALANISSTAAVLGGFSLTTMQIIPFRVDPRFALVESIYYTFAISAAGTCLLTVVFSQFSALFSMRLALRGGETSVEDTIARVRGEYQLVLLMLVSGVELFLCCIPFLCICKLKTHNAIIACILVVPMCFLVIYFYKRAKQTFFLKSDETFMSSKEKARKGKSHQNIDYLKDIDSRNEDRRVPHYSTRKKNDKKKNPLQLDQNSQHGTNSRRHSADPRMTDSHRSQRSVSEERGGVRSRGGGGGGIDAGLAQAQYIGPATRRESESRRNPPSTKAKRSMFASFSLSSFGGDADYAAEDKKLDSAL